MGIASEALAIDEMGRKLSAGLGIGSIHYHAADADEYRGYGFPGADEMGNMFQFFRDFALEVLAARSIETTRALNPSMLTFDEFIAQHKDEILAATQPAPA